MNRHDRGYFVVETLQAASESSQANVRAWLEDQGIKVRSFWVNNTSSSTRAKPLERAGAFPRSPALGEPRVPDYAGRGGRASPESKRDLAPAYHGTSSSLWPTKYTHSWASRARVWSSAAVDTGVEYNHMGLVNNYRGNLGGGNFDHTYSWFDPGGYCGGAPATRRHGTRTMGIMAGDDDPALPDGAWIAWPPTHSGSTAWAAPMAVARTLRSTRVSSGSSRPGGDPDLRHRSSTTPG